MSGSLERLTAALADRSRIEREIGAGGMATVYLANDLFHEFRNAADRAVSLNPLDAGTVAFMGILMAYTGDWERGCALAERAMQLNPHHPGWLPVRGVQSCVPARRLPSRACAGPASKLVLTSADDGQPRADTMPSGDPCSIIMGVQA